MNHIQLVTFGHLPSEETLAWARQTYRSEVKVFQAFLHADRLYQVEAATRSCFTRLAREGCDLSGNTLTVLCLPGLGIAVATVIAAWAGVTGGLPLVLNLIKQTDPSMPGRVFYAPSPERPVVALQGFRQEFGRKLREQHFTQLPKAA